MKEAKKWSDLEDGSRFIFDLIEKHHIRQYDDIGSKDNYKVKEYRYVFNTKAIWNDTTLVDIENNLLKALDKQCEIIYKDITSKLEYNPHIIAPSFTGFTQKSGTVMRRIYFYKGLPFDLQVVEYESDGFLESQIRLKVKYG